jgi:hypothetical protein
VRTPNDRDEGPQQRQRDQRRLQLGHAWEDRAEIADHAGGDGRIGDPQRHPVTPDRQERRNVAERAADVAIRTVRVGHLARQPGEHARQRDAAQHGDQPADRGVEAVRRERRRQQEDADADGVAHHQRRAHPEAELALAGVGIALDDHRAAPC